MLWKKLDEKIGNRLIFEKNDVNPNQDNYIKEKGIIQIKKLTQVIIPSSGLKKIFHKNKGRIPKNRISIIRPHERIHSRLNNDNIKRKIKTHFHCFIISLLNLTIKKEYDGIPKFKFKKIDSQITQNVNINYNKSLLFTPIKEILKKVSIKYHDRTQNEKIIYQIPDSKKEINKLLNCSYKEMYENYYLQSRNDMFINEKENNSFEYHLMKIQNKFGLKYMEIYKENAFNFIDFFLINKGRKQNLKNDILEEKKSIDLNNESISTDTSLNSKFMIYKENC